MKLAWLLAASAALCQEPVTIQVHAGRTLGPFRPVYAYFGYDEPNYTYMKNGRKLIGELAALNSAPVYIRAHNLLTTGDGTPALKWGSTNAYTEDASGRPVYDWTIVDRIFDTYLQAKARPFVEIGFMPGALSTHPQPYQHNWPKGAIDTGWAYPPKDYAKWGELVYRWVRHSVERYGAREVESWYWELWNEPDIFYWHGSPEEYDKLYDVSAAAVKRALPDARVGGPATTGPGTAKAAAFLRQFLEHCLQKGTPLDFISFHAKGRPEVVAGRVRMGLAQHLEDVEKGFEIVSSFPQFRSLPVVLSESDPEGCAACSARVYPQNAYRNGPLYAAYTAAAMSGILRLAERYRMSLAGVLTWAFEFEDQPYFDGFRTLATNGIDKPVLNAFRMLGLLRGSRVAAEGSDDVLATESERALSVLVWNYSGEDMPAPPSAVRILIDGLPAGASNLLLHHYRIDEHHSNSYAVWKAMGSPRQPSPEQYARLESAGQLELLESPRWLRPDRGEVGLSFPLPRQALSLLEISW